MHKTEAADSDTLIRVRHVVQLLLGDFGGGFAHVDGVSECALTAEACGVVPSAHSRLVCSNRQVFLISSVIYGGVLRPDSGSRSTPWWNNTAVNQFPMLQSPQPSRVLDAAPPSASPCVERLPTRVSGPVARIFTAKPRATNLGSTKNSERRVEHTKAVRARPCVGIKHRPSKLMHPSLAPRSHAATLFISAGTLAATPLAPRCTTPLDQPIRATCTTPPGAPTRAPRGQRVLAVYLTAV